MNTKILLAGALLLAATTAHADIIGGGPIYCEPQWEWDEPSGAVVLKTECQSAPQGPGSSDGSGWQKPYVGWDGADGIAVAYATYGQNCGAPFRNATSDVSIACNGAMTCWYTVDYRVLGDPAPGCSKNFVAQYTCPGSTVRHSVYVAPEAGVDKIATFNCQ